MGTYVQVKNGFVNGNVRDADIAAASTNIRTFLNSSTQDYKMKTSSRSYQEVLRAARVLIGEDFKGWLVANYKNGLGPCANIVGTILLYLNGQLSARSIGSNISIGESTVIYNNSNMNAWERRSITRSTEQKSPILLDNVTNFDYYRLLRGIGVEFLARLILVVLGENRYVK